MQDSEQAKSPLSRRDFLRELAAAGATLGVAGSIGATLSGEVIRNETSGGVQSRPWWVHTIDQPTTGVDWTRIERYDAFGRSVFGHGWAAYLGDDEVQRLYRLHADKERERILHSRPGYGLKTQALYQSFRVMLDHIHSSFLGPQLAPTPEERGVPRWTGSPEEASGIVKVALRHMGAASVGIVHLDENTRKLIYAADIDGKRILFDDVPLANETEDRRVIPNRCEWAIVYTVQMSRQTMRHTPTRLASVTSFLGYFRGHSIQNTLQEFLRGLGYQGLGEARYNALGISPALAVMAGLGELSRQNRLITPEYGPMVRIFKVLTDLPLAPDRPIDAGIARFCRVCMKCAEACPASALSFDRDPGWEPKGAWNAAGHQAWFEDGVKCRRYWLEEAGSDCGICFSVCPFSKSDRSFIEKFVRMQIANLPFLDGVTRSFDDALGYGGQKNPASWWQTDMPEYGIDTTQGK